MNKDWIYQTNIYEVNVRQYTEEGTFQAFVRHLSRLKDMGVETLWFMPITPIAQKNKKGGLGSPYACSDYTAVNPEFGTLQDFKMLVKTAHQLGLKIIIDWVANHTGWDHVWTQQYPEWFERDDATGDFKRASGMDDIIELDFTNPDMRMAMINAMKFWVEECGIDGFRCDLAYWIQLDFWVEARTALDAVKPLFWLAEADFADNPDYAQVFDAAYTWHWMHKAKDFAQGHLNHYDLMSVLYRYLDAPGLKSWFTSNHDENTWNGTEYEKYGYLAKSLAVFSCTWPGLPILYSGQELPNHKRLQFFDKDPIQWTEQPELHQFYQNLLSLRREEPALHAHALLEKLATSADDKVLAYQRCFGNSRVVVIINLSQNLQQINIHDKRLLGGLTHAISHGSHQKNDRQFQIESGGFIVLTNE